MSAMERARARFRNAARGWSPLGIEVGDAIAREWGPGSGTLSIYLGQDVHGRYWFYEDGAAIAYLNCDPWQDGDGILVRVAEAEDD